MNLEGSGTCSNALRKFRASFGDRFFLIDSRNTENQDRRY